MLLEDACFVKSVCKLKLGVITPGLKVTIYISNDQRPMSTILDLTLFWPWHLTLISKLFSKMNLSYKIMLKRGITLDSKTKSGNFHFCPRIMWAILDLTLPWPWRPSWILPYHDHDISPSPQKYSSKWICLTKLCGKELCITLDSRVEIHFDHTCTVYSLWANGSHIGFRLPWPWYLTLISQLIIKLNLSYKIMWKRGITLVSRTKSENVNFGHVGEWRPSWIWPCHDLDIWLWSHSNPKNEFVLQNYVEKMYNTWF